MIDRRLAGRVSIRRPYYAEIHRSIPYDIFAVIKSIIRNADNVNFQEPSCYIRGNRKAEVISFTSIGPVIKFFSLLSAFRTIEVDKFFSRTLTSTKRSGHKVKVVVEDTKDFAFFYKKSNASLTIQYHYGEWNMRNFPQS